MHWHGDRKLAMPTQYQQYFHCGIHTIIVVIVVVCSVYINFIKQTIFKMQYAYTNTAEKEEEERKPW